MPAPPAPRPRSPAPAPRSGAAGDVVALPVTRDDAALIAGLRAGEPWARAALFDRYAPQVERILRRVLGHEKHNDMADLIHDTFVSALSSIDSIRDAAALPSWMTTIAARTAYRAIRARRARRWLFFWEPSEVPEQVAPSAGPDVVEAHARVYALLDRMPADERVAFALRYVEGMELDRVAEACDVSLATVKRKLAKAEARFVALARRDEALRPWLEGGGRWTT